MDINKHQRALNFNTTKSHEQFAEHKQSRKKYDTEIVEFIKQLKTGSKLSNKNLKIILEKEHDIKISQATIIKIINDSY